MVSRVITLTPERLPNLLQNDDYFGDDTFCNFDNQSTINEEDDVLDVTFLIRSVKMHKNLWDD